MPLAEKACAILAYLQWRGEPVSRHDLAGFFWEGVSSELARNSLRQALFRIRTVIGSDLLAIESTTVALLGDISSDVELCLALADCTPGVRHSRRDFAQYSGIRGAAFDAWVALIRGGGTTDGVSPIHDPRVDGAAGTLQTIARDPSDDGVLLALWKRTVEGTGSVVWCAAEYAWLAQRLISTCRRHGGHIAHVSPVPTDRPDDVEQQVTRVLWAMAGAAGIQPERRGVLDRLSRNVQVDAWEQKDALWDLVCAVADEAPLLLVLDGWGLEASMRMQTLLTERHANGSGVRLLAVIIDSPDRWPLLPLLLVPVVANPDHRRLS